MEKKLEKRIEHFFVSHLVLHTAEHFQGKIRPIASNDVQIQGMLQRQLLGQKYIFFEIAVEKSVCASTTDKMY
jgi:hypothetical protein